MQGKHSPRVRAAGLAACGTAVLLCCGAASLPQKGGTKPTPTADRIVFEERYGAKGGHYDDLFRVYTNGTGGQSQMTTRDAFADVGPDAGRSGRIVYSKYPSSGGYYELWTADADGTNASKLVGGDGTVFGNGTQHWSKDKDSACVAYYGFDSAGAGGIYIIRADGTGKQLVAADPLPLTYVMPEWSHDLDRDDTNGYQGWLCFVDFDATYPDRTLTCWGVRVDIVGGVPSYPEGGPSLHPIFTAPQSWGRFWHWSPDGRRLAFYRDGNASVMDVLEDANGFPILPFDAAAAQMLNLTGGLAGEKYPPCHWSPDGAWLVLANDSVVDGWVGPGTEIYKVDVPASLANPGTRTFVRLTNNSWADSHPVWWTPAAP